MLDLKTPQKSQAEIRKIIDACVKKGLIDSAYDPAIHLFAVAIRGYYLAMGQAGKNDRMIYDDAIFIHAPNLFAAFQANTDPNGYRKGKGFGDGKGMASLDNGVWYFAIGPHKTRPSFRQAVPFSVTRDGDPPYQHTGWHAINLHSGGNQSTSSLGCQTIPASAWSVFKNLVYSKLDDCKNPLRGHDWTNNKGQIGRGTRSFPYILIEETCLRAGDLTPLK